MGTTGGVIATPSVSASSGVVAIKVVSVPSVAASPTGSSGSPVEGVVVEGEAESGTNSEGGVVIGDAGCVLAQLSRSGLMCNPNTPSRAIQPSMQAAAGAHNRVLLRDLS